jgi:predicted aconitase with swiveling domain
VRGRVIYKGAAEGRVLKSEVPLGLFGHLDPETGIYREAGHPLDGLCVSGRVLAFPRAKGSTVGSYVLFALGKCGRAPAALLLGECDTIVAVGAIISGIPAVDGLDLSRLEDGAWVRVRGREVTLETR